jgi:hypothetical protein
MSWDNQQYSELVLTLINKCIFELEYDALKPVFVIFFEMLKLSDNLIIFRFEKGVSRFLDIVMEKRKLPKKTKECILFIHRMTEIPQLKAWLTRKSDKLSWISKWKKEHSDLF